MSPKQKAKQLIETYSVLSIYNTKIFDNVLASEIRGHIKISALIAVNEIMLVACDESDFDETMTKRWWQEVKQEIEKL